METRNLAPQEGALVEQVVIKGNLADLTPAQRVDYYRRVCDSIGINPLTQPFQYLTLNGRLILYATRGCTDQIRDKRHLTAHVTARERIDDVYVVTARVTAPDGRSDEAVGAVAIGGLKGEALANALMKAETKAKRRATLSLVGLGYLDETEVESIPAARPGGVNLETGEIEGPTQSSALPVGSKTPTPTTCADCGQQVASIQVGRTVYDAERVAATARRRFGRQLCYECAKRAAAKQAGDRGEPVIDPAPVDVEEAF